MADISGGHKLGSSFSDRDEKHREQIRFHFSESHDPEMYTGDYWSIYDYDCPLLVLLITNEYSLDIYDFKIIKF